jgi:hypothetical protein
LIVFDDDAKAKVESIQPEASLYDAERELFLPRFCAPTFHHPAAIDYHTTQYTVEKKR